MYFNCKNAKMKNNRYKIINIIFYYLKKFNYYAFEYF